MFVTNLDRVFLLGLYDSGNKVVFIDYAFDCVLYLIAVCQLFHWQIESETISVQR